MPDFVITVTAAPPAIPCSASKLLVEMLTVSMVSAGEMYMLWFGSQMFMFVAPSVRVDLTRDEVFPTHEGHRLEERLRRLNELGFDVEEVELISSGGKTRRASPGACGTPTTASRRR